MLIDRPGSLSAYLPVLLLMQRCRNENISRELTFYIENYIYIDTFLQYRVDRLRVPAPGPYVAVFRQLFWSRIPLRVALAWRPFRGNRLFPGLEVVLQKALLPHQRGFNLRVHIHINQGRIVCIKAHIKRHVVLHEWRSRCIFFDGFRPRSRCRISAIDSHDHADDIGMEYVHGRGRKGAETGEGFSLFVKIRWPPPAPGYR